MDCKILCLNKKAEFKYTLFDSFIAGMVLTATEIKSIREGKVNIQDAFCCINNGEIFIRQMHIAKYKYGSFYNHDEYRVRKLLLNKKEILKLKNKESKYGTIIPTKVFINHKGLAKIEIALAKGKKIYDKRREIKEKELKRQTKNYL